MASIPRMRQLKNGGPLAKEWLRHLPQPQSYESFRTPKRLSRTSASGDFFRAVMSVEAALAFSLFLRHHPSFLFSDAYASLRNARSGAVLCSCHIAQPKTGGFEFENDGANCMPSPSVHESG